MRRKMIRCLCFLVSVVFMFSLLSACGQMSEKSDNTTSSGTVSSVEKSVQETTTVAQLPFVTINWYMGIPLDPRPNEKNVMAEINKQLKEKINANVVFNMMDFGTLTEKMNVMIASGDPFDLVMTGAPLGFSSNVGKDAYLPIDDLLGKYGKDILALVPESAWPAVTFSGKRYAVLNPTVWCTPAGFVFKKDLVDKYNIDVSKIHNLQDLAPYFETLKKNEPDITPLDVTREGAPCFGGYAVNDDILPDATGSSLITYSTEQNKLLYWWEDPYFLKDAKTINEYYKLGYIKKGAASMQNWFNEMKTGKYAVCNCVGVYDPTFVKSSQQIGFPCAESFWAQNPIGTANIQWPVTAIGKNSKNPERAMMLINLMFGDKKFFNTVCYGIENQDYKVVSGAGTDNPTVEANTPNTWAIWHPWIGPLWTQWPSNWNSAEALKTLKYNTDNGKMSPIVGFIFNQEPVKKEIAQINTLLAELVILKVGVEPDLQKYIDDLKAKYLQNGADKIMAEVQKQLDAWKKANGK